MAKTNSNRRISNPSECLFGVAIHVDGTFEKVGIGSFDASQASQLADQLVSLAEAIRAKSGQRSALLAA